MRFWWAVPCLLAIGGCGHSSPSTPAARASLLPIKPDPWVLQCNDPSASEPALLWNGLVGLRFARDGDGVGPDGKLLARFDIDAYDRTGEEKIRQLANPVQDVLEANGTKLDPSGGVDYMQTIDMRTGELTTAWTQTVGSAKLRIERDAVLHPSRRIVAERWIVKSSEPGGEAKLSLRTGNAQIESDALSWSTQSGPNSPSPGSWSVDRVLCMADPGHAAVTAAPKETFDEVFSAAKAVWAKRWRTDIEIDGPAEDQQAVRSFLFYLRSAIDPESPMAISPFGLSDSTYNGHVFWDADLWVFPALALIDPDEAAAIPKYRLARFAAAQKNFEQWVRAGRPIARGAMGPASPPQVVGAMYPWESSVTGGETVPGPSRFEHHITGSVAFGLEEAASLGLANGSEVRKVIDAASAFYRRRSQPGPNGRTISQTMSPDENFTGDNDLYTNLVAEWVTNGGAWKPKPSYYLPKDATSFLTYDNDPVRTYKQAAAVLSIYPLQYPPAEAEASIMMRRFSDKAIKNGPAMTDSVHSIVWSRLGEAETAYQSWRSSWRPFMTGPLCLFSEKRTKATAYFTTGAAGSLQAVLYGFLGFRIDSAKSPGAAWSTNLIGNRYLSVRPHLPKEWKSVKFKNFTILGRRYTLSAVQDAHGGACRVTQGD